MERRNKLTQFPAQVRKTRRKGVCFKVQPIGAAILIAILTACSFQTQTATGPSDRPNIILIMADDLGFGDVGFNGNRMVKTPVLDSMARASILFTRFYAAAPVCTPTRASVLTGRHPYRMNMTWASAGGMPEQEYTIAEVLKDAGYATGHFGKWHVGDLSRTLKEGYAPGPIDTTQYAPPWEHGFDESYSVLSSMPLYNPYYLPCEPSGSDSCRMIMDKEVASGQMTGGFAWPMKIWTGPGKFVDAWPQGPFDALVMDQAVDFVTRKSREQKPFLSLIWFSTPHTPVVASKEHRDLYPGLPIREQHWYGSITAMDEQIGRLRATLKNLGIADNTILWFCSDNGPSWVHELNSAGGLKGKKGSLWEGGIRVPAVLEYPKLFKEHKVIHAPVTTSDLFPTLLKWAGVKAPANRSIDGIDVTDIVSEARESRPSPIGFQSPVLQTDARSTSAWLQYSGRAMVWLDNNYKLISDHEGKTWALYDLSKDRKEEIDLAASNPERVERMKKDLLKWVESCSRSAEGMDYHRVSHKIAP